MSLEGFVAKAPSVIAGDPNRAKLLDWMRFRHSYCQWLLSQIEEYDAFVLRYYVHDPFQLMFIRRCPKPARLITKCNTLESSTVLPWKNTIITSVPPTV